jgi:lipopolysaccharide export system permease protein
MSKIQNERLTREVTSYFLFGKYMEKGWNENKKTTIKKVKYYGDLLPDSVINIVFAKAADKTSILKNSTQVIVEDYVQRAYDLRLFKIEWHKKFALSFACIVLFIIGAPLGSIIRKGGLGMPLVVAVGFFLVFHF